MGNRRMITSDIWDDEFVGSLTFLERCLWIGLITLADDQGRLLDNVFVLTHKIFLYDENVKPQQVRDGVSRFCEAGKLVSYAADGKNLLQIVNWWRHQNPQWPQPSKYPPPERWTDKVKIHILGNKIYSINMDRPGGFDQDEKLPTPLPTSLPTSLPTGLPTPLKYPIEESREESRVEESRVNNNDPPFPENGDLSLFSAAFVQETHIPELKGGPTRWIKGLQDISNSGATPDDMRQAIRELMRKSYNIIGPWSVVNATITVMSRRKGNDSKFVPAEVF